MPSLPVQIVHFFIHLRLHYQFFLLSGGYLLGGFLAGTMNTEQYWLQFLNVHILLFGGATAFNSFWDKDTGPIGGLKNPPKMSGWMRHASLLFMAAGQLWALAIGPVYAFFYFVSMLLFWLYSTPLARWKQHPLYSLVAIGVSTGTNSVFMGVLAAGGELSIAVALGAFGAALVLLSLYPVSQLFQIEEDRSRGDRTFAVEYGAKSVKTFFAACFVSGVVLLTLVIWFYSPTAAAILFAGCCFSFIILSRIIFTMQGNETEYALVMKSKLIASCSFVIYFLAANAISYQWISF